MPTTADRVIQLHPQQREFRRSGVLYRGFVGGRGAGKSWVGAYDTICRATRESSRGLTFLVASPTGVLMGDTTFPTFCKLAKELNAWGGVRLTPYPNVTLRNGATVRFRTAEDPERLRGPNLSGIWLDEASLMPEEAYTIAIGCLREAGAQGWLSATFTPKGPNHWTYKVFAKGRADTAIFRSHTRENPFNPPGFAETLAKQYDHQFARQELGGEFVEVEGAEWPAAYFDRAEFWFDDWPDTRARVYSLDPSKGNRDRAGDWQAHVMLGLALNGDLLFDAVFAREDVTAMIGRAVDTARAWGWINSLVVEDNGTMGLIAPEVARQCRERNAVLPWETITNTMPKLTRIRKVGPYLATGRVRVRNSPGGRMLVEQWRDVPNGEFDDGPDAAATALIRMEALLSGR